MLSYTKGDLFDLYEKNIKSKDNIVLIPHVCNDIGSMGSGFVVPLNEKWPIVRNTFRAKYRQCVDCFLGDNQYIDVEKNVVVVNMIAQHGVMSWYNKQPLHYGALHECMTRLVQDFDRVPVEIHCPKFGSVLAGGDWNIIEVMIKDIWKNIETTVYELE